MKKNLLTAILVFVLALTIMAPLTVSADWQQLEDGTWMYYSEKDHIYLTDGIYEINGKYYWFDYRGNMWTGWIKQEYTFHGDTYVNWYYADSSGALAVGWKFINKKWYYFGKDFVMYSGGMYEIGNKHYYFYPSGAMGTGWIAWTYDYGDGTDYTAWYYADSNGALMSGWQWIGGAWYYFYPDNNIMVSDSEFTVGGKTYFFDKSGRMCTGWCKQTIEYGSGYSSERWYYADSSGVLREGWQKIGGVWYYFSNYMLTGTAFIDGEIHAFDGSGAWTTRPGWMEDKNGSYSTWYYLDANGKPVTGWKKINGVWYYFNDFYGQMYSNGYHYIDGKNYAFEKSGAWISGTGWKKITYFDGSSDWIYVEDGEVLSGWQYINGAWYYLAYSGTMVAGNYVVDGIVEQFSASGAWMGHSTKTGWVKIDQYNRWVYVETNGSLAKGWRTIDGVTYYFNPDDGYMNAGDVWWADDDYYFFDDSGALLTGFIKTKWGEIYYANEDGVLQTGWKNLEGYTCYFGPYGYGMVRGGTRKIDGKEYSFDTSGRLMVE